MCAKKYKTRHHWVEKEILCELWKKFKFDHINKLYIHYPESVLENETDNILKDLKIEMDF